MAGSGRPSPGGPPRSKLSGRGRPPASAPSKGLAPGTGGIAERLARPARRRAAGVRRSDSMRSILAAHTWRKDVRNRLRDALESTMSFLPFERLGLRARVPDSRSERPLLPAAGVFRFWRGPLGAGRYVTTARPPRLGGPSR